MKKAKLLNFLLVISLIFSQVFIVQITVIAGGELPTMAYTDLTNWYQEGPLGDGNWTVQPGGREVNQSINGGATFFISPERTIDEVIMGTMKVDTGTDDDFIGFVMGFQDPTPVEGIEDEFYDFILFDWKKGTQGDAKKGFTLAHAYGVFDNTNWFGSYSPYLWYHYNTPGKFDVLAKDDAANGWEFNTEYTFQILYTSSRIKIKVDDVLIFDEEGSFPEGKFGFYNSSQEKVTYGRVKTAPGTNDPVAPIAQTDRYGTRKNTAIDINKYDGILANDYDPNLDNYSITNVSGVSHGTLHYVDPNGSFSYTPDPDFTGTDSFTYSLTETEDDTKVSETVTVYLNVIDGENVAPTSISLSGDRIMPGFSNGTIVGTLATTDPNAGDFHDYMLIDNAGGRFGIVGDKIVVNNSSAILSELYTIEVRSTDFNGLYVDEEFTIIGPDITPPLASYNLSPELPTNQNVVIRVNTADPGGTGVYTITLPDGSEITADTTEYTAVCDGTYTFVISDFAGNNTNLEVEIPEGSINKVGPTITLGDYPTQWVNENITVTATAHDSKGEDISDELNEQSHTFTANGCFLFSITDGWGNSATKPVTVTNIDKQKPNTPSIQVEESSVGIDSLGGESNPIVTNKDVIITIDHNGDSGDSGVEKLEYSLDEGETWAVYDSPVEITAEASFTVQARAVDNAGNISEIATDDGAIIDKQDPNEPVIVLNPNSSWTNENVSVTITAGDNGLAGLESIEYELSGAVTQGKTLYTADETIEITTPGVIVLTAYATDKAGNVSEASKTIRIDKTQPSGSFSLNEALPAVNRVTITITCSDEGGSGVESVTLPDGSTIEESIASYEIESGGTYNFEIKDLAGNSATILYEMPEECIISVPGAPTNVSVSAGIRNATVSFDPPSHNGGSEITEYIVTSLPEGKTARAASSPIRINGLNTGIEYTFVVTAVNIAGSGADSVQSNPVTPRSNPRNDDTTSSPSPTPTPLPPPASGDSAEILINGMPESAGTENTVKEDEKTITTVIVDQDKLEERLREEGDHAVITIPIAQDSDVVIGELNGQMVKSLELKSSVLEVKTEKANYIIPAEQINIEDISERFGEDVELQDIKVRVEISAPNDDTVRIAEDSANQGKFVIIAPPVEFTIQCVHEEKTISVEHFNAYVERTIAIPEGVDPNKITTGVVIDANGDVRHIPTKIIIIDGKYYAQMNSLTNSTYSVIYHPVEFTDVETHREKDAINEMGSRLIVSGVGDGKFDPDSEATRVDFVMVIVRSLGLKPVKGENPFIDVSESTRFYPYVQTAYDYGIISGFGDGTFHPEEKITLEQAMSVLARAMKITKLDILLKEDEIIEILKRISSRDDIGLWARESTAACIKAGILSEDKKFFPKGLLSRTEMILYIRKLLERSDLI